MADDQAYSNEGGEENGSQEASDNNVSTTTLATNNVEDSFVDDYPDEPIEDFVVKLVVDDVPEGVSISPDLVNAVITDIHGNVISSKTPLIDSINGYTTTIYDELNGNGSAITGGKGWWGWSTLKLIVVGLIALCILGIILAILFLVIGKKFKKNKNTTTAGSTTTTKAVVTKGVSSDPKYHQVPNV